MKKSETTIVSWYIEVEEGATQKVLVVLLPRRTKNTRLANGS